MEKQAIQHLQITSNIPAIMEGVQAATSEKPFVAVPHDFDIKNIESLMPNAQRYRLGFKTKSIADFLKYNKKFDAEGATCFVDSSDMNALTIFDLGTIELPLHKQHKADLSLEKTAAFNAFLRYDGEKISQKAASDFLEDWEDHIVVVGQTGSEMNVKAAAAALRDLTIETARSLNSKVEDFGAQMSAMEQIEAKSKGELPSIIQFKCVPYFGLSERVLTMRVSILTGGDKPTLVLRALKLETVLEEVAEEFKGLIEDGLKDDQIETFIGRC
ncbi:protein YfdQ [Vibrio phage 340E47.2]|nr:protein YfdQ [Vibrio phage 340E47.2]QZI91937.1 hypothetical protein PODOV077v1_p0026 [Vibrio phage 5P1a]